MFEMNFLGMTFFSSSPALGRTRLNTKCVCGQRVVEEKEVCMRVGVLTSASLVQSRENSYRFSRSLGT